MAAPYIPPAERAGGRAGNPVGVPSAPPTPVFKLPKVKAPPTPDPYKQSVQQNLQYLTAKQRAETQRRQAQLDALTAKAHANAVHLAKFRDLSTKGEQGVRAQQALLRQAGYNVAVDGKFGQQTAGALNDYLAKQETQWNTKLSDTAKWAHPLSLRAEANAAFKPQQVTNTRNFVLGYVSSQQRDLRAALAKALQEQRVGKQGAAETAGHIKDAIAGLDRLRQVAMDPVRGLDATDLHKTMQKIILRQQNDLQQANLTADSQAVGIKSLLAETAVETLSKATLNIFNRGSSAFAAAFETGLKTGNYGKAIEAFVGGFTSFIRVPGTDISLVGLIAPGGSDARKYIEATNSNEEMDALVKKGDLLSFGQTLTGHVTDQFAKRHPLGLGGAGTVAEALLHGDIGIDTKISEGANTRAQSETKTVHGFDLLSAAADFGAAPIKDPSLLAGEVIKPLSEFGNVERGVAKAMEGAKFASEGERAAIEEAVRTSIRTARIETTVTGRALMSRVEDIIGRSTSAFELEKAIPGLGHDAALAAIAAKESADGGVEAARAVIQNEFTAGRWNPHISVVRQLTNDIGGRIGFIAEDGTKGGLGLEASIGSKAVKMTDRLAAIRVVAEPKGPIAAAYERDAVGFVNESLDAASAVERTTVKDLWSRIVEQGVKGLDIEARFYNVMESAYKLDNPQLQAAFEGNMRPFLSNPSQFDTKVGDVLNHIPLGSYMEAAFNQAGFEEAVQRMELLAAIATGGAGDSAFKQLSADLARGFLLPKNPTKVAFQTAVQNVGLKLGSAAKKATRKDVAASIKDLPEKDRKFFEDRLNAITGKAGLGRLAKDVELAKGSPDLRDELARLLEQQQGRVDQAAEGALPKPGLARRIRQIPTKLVLANTDVVPPTELRFKYKTPNELYHSQLRAKAATRYLDAFYVPAAVKSQLVRAIEKVQTEEEFFGVVERMTRAAMEAKGIENADGVMQLLKARGDFSKVLTKPFRTIIDGEPIEDLQTLAQRIETQRLYSPAEVAAATRKAVLDGIEDASTARRFAARLRIDLLDNLGNMKLHFTHLDGREMTILSSAKSLHRMWKFLIVTNAGMPVIGAAAGFLGTQGNIGDRLHNAGLGFAIGAAGSTRYIFRVVGLEDRIRMLLDQGLTSDIHMPAWAKLQSRRYSEDYLRRTMSDDLVRLGNHGTQHFENDLLTHVDPDWIVLDRGHARSVDAWYRIINHQIHPESDPVMAILLREQAGHLGGTEDVTRVVKVGAEETSTPANLFHEAFGTAGAPADTRSEFQKQMDALAGRIENNGIAPVRVTNEDLLADHGGSDTKVFYRGEDNAIGHEYPSRGDSWIPEDYNKGKGEAYARKFAGEDGRVYRVELPVDAHGVPVVGELAGEGNLGWVLAGEDAKWADSAEQLLPNGFAATAGDRATYVARVESTVITAQQDAERQIAAFLDTEEGQLWKERWKGGIGGTSNPKKAVARMREFLDRYSTPELANLRIAGGVNGVPGTIEHDTLKRMLKNGIGPDSFHAQQVWRMPKNAKELFQSLGKIESKLVLTGPSNLFNRGPYFRSMFYKEYDRLVMNGTEKELARQLADISAANHVNSILHRFEEPSRFAAKVDIFMPFQHAREDIFRVYGKLAIEHPVNTMRLVSYAAKLFNDGKSLGIFTKNEFTGQWEMTVPGSGRLSHSLFKVPFDATFHANIKDMLFVANGAYGVGFLPQPGGLFWTAAAKLLAEAKPELFTGKYPLHNWLWGYGPQGNLLRKDTSRLWMAFTGETPPWERLSQDDWKNQHDRWQTEVAQELIYQHRLKNPKDRTWFPSQDDVDEATKNFYEAWAFIGSTFPASSYPTLTGQDKYWAARNAYTAGGILPWDPQGFLKKYPEFEPYTVGSDSKYVGPDDLATLKQFNVGGYNGLSTFDPATGKWSDSGPSSNAEDYTTEGKLGYRKYRSFSKFKDDFKFYARTSEYFRKLEDARALQKKNPILGEQALISLNKDYSDVVTKTRRTYDITKDLYNINWMYPKALRAGAIQRVKNQFGLSNSDLNYFMQKAVDPTFLPNAWREARLGSEVDADVRAHFGNTITGGASNVGHTGYGQLPVNGDVEKYVATLNPAEQANYWKWQKNALGYDPGLDDPSKVMAKYGYFQKQLSAVYKEYPFLLNSTKRRENYDNPFTVAMNKVTGDLNTQATATYTSIDKIQSEMQAAAQAKNWKAYYALKAQRDNLYDVADAIHNKLLNKLPDLTKYYDDLHAAALEGAAGNAKERDHYMHQAAIDKANAPYFLIAEQRRFLNEPPAVKRAYMATLVQGLDMPAGKLPYDVKGYVKETTGLSKLFWDYLTPTQQDLLRANFPQYVQRWMYDSEYNLRGGGSNGGKGPLPKELQWAYEQLNKYSQRGDMKRPSSYDEYLKLPSNLAAREQFLNAHPDVRAYLNAGPFKHMPPALRDQVSSILNKYGNYNGHSQSAGYSGGKGTHIKDRGLGYEGNVNVAWAKEQLYIWSRRKNPDGTYQQKPAEYDQWVNMPTGIDKANFLKSHPDLENWIKLGPMANMPEEYKAVVRDIMYRYGEWTQKDDPLGQTITQFFATPGYARQDFLAKHPELEAYWSATRSPEDEAMFALQNQYFQIQDVQAKRAFLAAHPELQQHFIDARTKRYEAFLNQTAVFMGANPEMFTQYLNRQTDIMAELLRKFAEPVVIQEAGPTYVSADSGGGSRQRHEQKPPRVRASA